MIRSRLLLLFNIVTIKVINIDFLLDRILIYVRIYQLKITHHFFHFEAILNKRFERYE